MLEYSLSRAVAVALPHLSSRVHLSAVAEDEATPLAVTTLTYNPRTGEYVVFSNERERCESVGLTRSTTRRGPAGETCWFTSVPHAALSFYEEGTQAAKESLASLWADYRASWALDGPDFPTPPGRTLMPFQRGGVAYAMARTNSLIGDQPGLGKTAMSIAVANAAGAQRVLVVCPASIRLNWRREILAWSTIPNVSVACKQSARDGASPYPHYTVISYELTRARGMHEALYDLEWDLLIVDEAHFLKSPEAERTRSLFGGGRSWLSKSPIAERAKRIVALTGTPLPNRPREAYTLARALAFDSIDWMSYDDFCFRFNPSARMESGHVKEERGRLPELQARLRCSFMVRRLKEDVMRDLPDKRYELAYVEPSGEIRDVLAKEKLIHFSVEDLKDPLSEIWGMISTVRREMGEAKVPRIVEHVRMLLDVMELPKVVLFCHHRSVMDRLRYDLDGYGYVEVRGGMTSAAKDLAIQRFRTDPRVRVWCGQLDAAGFGIDGLQDACSWAVIAEPAWSPGVNEQAVDRLHRHGQHSNVVAQFLVVEGSLDERVLALVLEKVRTTHATLDGYSDSSSTKKDARI